VKRGERSSDALAIDLVVEHLKAGSGAQYETVSENPGIAEEGAGVAACLDELGSVFFSGQAGQHAAHFYPSAPGRGGTKKAPESDFDAESYKIFGFFGK
jgi:hypothetical protein